MAQKARYQKTGQILKQCQRYKEKISNGVIPTPPVNSINVVANYDVSAI